MIIAHNQFDLLKILCELLDHSQHDIYIHIDKKAVSFQESQFVNLTKYSKIYFTERTSIAWGGYSMINAELILLQTAMSNDNYVYYHLLSGCDLPLKKSIRNL